MAEIKPLKLGATGTEQFATGDSVPVASGGVPSGGTTGQILAKNSNTNFDLVWATNSTNYTGQTANYTALATDTVINITANSVTVSLPTAVGITGKQYTIKNSAAGQLTIVDPDAGETIDGAATFTILFREAITVCSTGANWIII